MDPLPKQRVQMSRPFTITGVDFAGPLQIQSGIRHVTTKKAWILAVFVCFATRAIHLEPVVGLTSEAFLALRWFMARRGNSAKIYSDNATNFVGVQKELKAWSTVRGTWLMKKFNGISTHHQLHTSVVFGKML